MNKRLLIASISGFLLILPFFISAVPLPQGQPFGGQPIGLSAVIDGVLNIMYPVFFGLSAIIFLVAAYMFLTAQGEPDKLKTARDTVIWGVVALIVAIIALSIFWIVNGLFGGGAP